MSDVHIRDARPSDQDSIREVTLAAYHEYAAELPDFWKAYRLNILTTLADTGLAQQIVAEQDGAVVGAVLLYPFGFAGSPADGTVAMTATPEVRLLAVAPEGRGRGLGEALMRECVQRARASGAAALTLHTTDLMRVAIRLYDRMGFVRSPELDFGLAPGLSVKGYRMHLDAAAA